MSCSNENPGVDKSSTSRSAASCALRYPVSIDCNDDMVRDVMLLDDDDARWDEVVIARAARRFGVLRIGSREDVEKAAVEDRVASESKRLMWRNIIVMIVVVVSEE
mmetsp:Transcript_15590/g.24191  ORF Transcript_15590/g.24191 Transcript_15590/m.24191 type:complete len:106 (-) Transcript_15590:7-324(-)